MESNKASAFTCACALFILLCHCRGADSQLGQCTSGFFQDINNVAGVPRVTALPSVDRPDLDFVQWLFPFLTFTCRGNITRWRVRVEQIDPDFEAEDLVQWNIPQLMTWRKMQVPGPPSLFRPTAYEQVSITNKTLSTIRMVEGSVYEYNLTMPTEVEHGDIVGIQLPLNMELRQRRTTKPLFLELLSGNASMYSYIKLDNSTLAVIPPPDIIQPLQTFIPLISVRIESNERECTAGFLNDITDTGGEPVPLPSMNRPNLDFVQWLFPFMSFTCEVKITRWELRIEQIDLDFEEGDRWNLPQISTWRPRQAQGFPSTAGVGYELTGITNETLSTVINKGSVFEYRLSTPIVVEPGHIVGIQMPLNMRERLSRSTKLLFWQLTNGNISYLSYSSLQNRTTIVVSPFEIIEPIVTFIPLISVHIEPLDAPKTTEIANNPSGTNAAGLSIGTITGIGVSISAAIVLLAVVTTTVIIAVAISHCRRNKKGDKTGTQIHHTLPIYDTIPDIQESSNNHNISSSRAAIPRHTTSASERRDRNNLMQQPNRHPVGSTRTRLEAHNNIMILDGNQQQRARESIQTRENEAYMYVVADQYYDMHAPVQETNPEDHVNECPSKKEAENYIYPVANKWVHIIQKD